MFSIDESLVGQLIDGVFRITSLVGVGGMGATFEATRVDLNRKVCLKFIKPDYLSAVENLERFRREAKVLAALSHPNIVTCYSFGLFDNIYPYLAMEFIEGTSLKALCTEKPLSWERACTIVIQLCSALEYLHKKGVVHRDIKPENVMITTTASGEDIAKLIDFGLVGKFVGSTINVPTLTSVGTLMGTANYMAPECFSGARGDRFVDIYAVGCLLFELLSATLPFDADNPIAVAYKHENERLPSLPDKIRPHHVRKRIEEVIWTATAKQPQERFSSCSDIALVLTDCLNYGREEPQVKLRQHRDEAVVQSRLPRVAVALTLIAALAMVVVPGADRGLFTRRTEEQHQAQSFNLFTKDAKALADRWSRQSAADDQTLCLETCCFVRALSVYLAKHGCEESHYDRSLGSNSFATSIARNLSVIGINGQTRLSAIVRNDMLELQADLLTCFGYYPSSFRIIDKRQFHPVDGEFTRGRAVQFFKELMKRTQEHVSAQKMVGARYLIRRIRPAIPALQRIGVKMSELRQYVSFVAVTWQSDVWRPSLPLLLGDKITYQNAAERQACMTLICAGIRAGGDAATARDLLTKVLATGCSPDEVFTVDMINEYQNFELPDSALECLRKQRSASLLRGQWALWLKYSLFLARLERTRNESISRAYMKEVFACSQWHRIMEANSEPANERFTLLLWTAEFANRYDKPEYAPKYLEAARRYIERYADSWTFHYHLANVMMQCGLVAQADQRMSNMFRSVSAVSSAEKANRQMKFSCFLSLAEWYQSRGADRKAMLCYEHALRECRDPESCVPAKLKLAACLDRTGELDKSMQLRKECLEPPNLQYLSLIEHWSNLCGMMSVFDRRQQKTLVQSSSLEALDVLVPSCPAEIVHCVSASVVLIDRFLGAVGDDVYSRRVLETRQRATNSYPTLSAIYQHGLADWYLQTGNFAQVRERDRRAVALANIEAPLMVWPVLGLENDLSLGLIENPERVLKDRDKNLATALRAHQLVADTLWQQGSQEQVMKAVLVVDELLDITKHNLLAHSGYRLQKVVLLTKAGREEEARKLLSRAAVSTAFGYSGVLDASASYFGSAKTALPVATGGKIEILQRVYFKGRTAPGYCIVSLVAAAVDLASEAGTETQLCEPYLEDALQLVEKLRMLDGSTRAYLLYRGRLANALARCYERSGNLPAAIRYAKMAIAAGTFLEVLSNIQHLAEVEHKARNMSGAEQSYQRAINLIEGAAGLPRSSYCRRVVGGLYLSYASYLSAEGLKPTITRIYYKLALSQFIGVPDTESSITQCRQGLAAN